MYQPNFLGSERKTNVLYRLAQENVQTKLFCMNIDITAPFINYHNFSKCLYHFFSKLRLTMGNGVKYTISAIVYFTFWYLPGYCNCLETLVIAFFAPLNEPKGI